MFTEEGVLQLSDLMTDDPLGVCAVYEIKHYTETLFWEINQCYHVVQRNSIPVSNQKQHSWRCCIPPPPQQCAIFKPGVFIHLPLHLISCKNAGFYVKATKKPRLLTLETPSVHPVDVMIDD